MDRSTQIGLMLVAVSSLAWGQQCDDSVAPTLSHDFLRPQGYGFTGSGAECFDSESYFHFSAARGAFANALSVEGRWNAAPEQLPNTCAVLDQSGNSLASCLKYTGDCGASGVGPVCTGDPLSQSGEISCSCQIVPPQKLQDVKATNGFPPVGAGTDHGFFAQLNIDEDVDGKVDRFADTHRINNTNVPPFLVRPVSRGLWRLEWEDLFPNDQADFNDYVASYEIHECRPGRWPLDADQGVNDCLDECGNPAVPRPGWCVEGPSSKVLDDMKFHADVAFDVDRGSDGIVQFESLGPKMTVSLSTHNTFTKQALIDLMKAGSVAICPIVALRAETYIYKRDRRIGLHYGGGCGASGALSGQPVCSETKPAPYYEEEYLFIGLGNSYLTTTSSGVFDNSCDVTQGQCTTNTPSTCNSREPSDILPPGILTEPTACNGNGTGHFARWYEVPLRDIATATSPPFDAAYRNGRQSGTLAFVDVLVFSEIKTPEFACPTGIDILFRGVDPAIAKVQRFHISVGNGLTQRWFAR